MLRFDYAKFPYLASLENTLFPKAFVKTARLGLKMASVC